MGWQDRDYARQDGGPGGYGPLIGRRRSRHSSIVRTLIIVNVVVFVLCYMTPLGPYIRGTGPQYELTPMGPVVSPGQPGWCEMITSKVMHGQVWRLVTSQYLHASRIVHILFNMIGLLFLGPPLEQRWGARKFLAVYTLAGISGNLLLMAAGLVGWIHPDIPAVGASGCILGLLGAAAVLFPQAEVYIYFLFPVKIRTVAVVFTLMYAYNVYQQGANYGGDLCHLAGLGFGVWYARWGDRWWFYSGLRRTILRAVQSFGIARSTPGRVGPGAWEARMQRRVTDAAEVDRILKKVYEGGISTLSEREKRTLAEATERQRQEDLKAKRGW
jgi:membrane associated rhomboid family serine protease